MSRDACIETAKDLLIYGAQHTDKDESLESQWEQSVAGLARSQDLFSSSVTIPAVPEQAVYRAPDNMTRIFSLAFNGRTLGYTDKANLDFTKPEWTAEESSTPRLWVHNRVQREIDSLVADITPKDFVLFPPPDGASARAESIHVIYGHIPDQIPLWLEPILTYTVVAEDARQNPNLAETEKAEWFDQLAQLWLEVAKVKLEI